MTSCNTSTLRKDIEQTPGAIEVVRIEAYADPDWGRYGMESWARYDLPYVGPLEDAPEGLLDQEYDAGYGSPDRPMWTAWSATHVGFGVEYDGATGSGAVPRNPPVVGGVGDKERPANHSESMRHDPMCPMLGVGYEASTFCYCERLRERDARARADERERIAQAIEAQATTQECISLRTTGPALPPDIDCGCWVCADHRLVGRFASIARGEQP